MTNFAVVFFLSSPYLEFCDPFHHFLNVNRGGFTTNKFETNSDRENKVNRAILCYLNAKVCYLGPVSRSQCLALTIALEVSKPIRFYGSYRWLALTMLRETRAWYFGGFFFSPLPTTVTLASLSRLITHKLVSI